MKLNILLTFNDKYVNNVFSLINSIAKNITSDCDIYLLHSDISQQNINKLKKHTTNCFSLVSYSGRIIDYIFPLELVYELPTKVGKNTWSEEMYFRLFAPFLLPNIDRCLYLDSDTIVCGDINEFYNKKFEGNYLLAVANDTQEKHKNRLNLTKEKVYINSGVLLFNCEKIRNSYSINEIKDMLYKLRSLYAYPDQDFINLFYDKKIGLVEKKYNYMINVAEISNSYSSEKDIRICHYVMEKPWTIRFPYKTDKIYLKYSNNIFKNLKLLILHRCYRFYQLLFKTASQRKIKWFFEKNS